MFFRKIFIDILLYKAGIAFSFLFFIKHVSKGIPSSPPSFNKTMPSVHAPSSPCRLHNQRSPAHHKYNEPSENLHIQEEGGYFFH